MNNNYDIEYIKLSNGTTISYWLYNKYYSGSHIIVKEEEFIKKEEFKM